MDHRFGLAAASIVLVFGAACDTGRQAERVEGTLPEDCSDGADNDANRLFDCDDTGCAATAACRPKAAGKGTGPAVEPPPPVPPAREPSIRMENYTNTRFGYSVSYPATFAAQPEAENGDGRRFIDAGGAALAVWGMWDALDEGIAGAYRSANSQPGRVVTYHTLNSHGYVVSGLEGSTVFYENRIVSDAGEGAAVFTVLRFTYPVAAKAMYDPMVKPISESLRPGRPI